MNTFLDPVEFSLASKGIRFANYLIDFVVLLAFVIIIFIFFEVIGASILDLSDINPFLDRILSALLYFLIMSFQEFFFKGRSVGKFITGTIAVTEDGKEMTLNTVLLRNISRIIPFEPLSFFGTLGWHDSISKTRVVNKKEFEQNSAKFNSIDQIGKPEII